MVLVARFATNIARPLQTPRDAIPIISLLDRPIRRQSACTGDNTLLRREHRLLRE